MVVSATHITVRRPQLSLLLKGLNASSPRVPSVLWRSLTILTSSSIEVVASISENPSQNEWCMISYQSTPEFPFRLRPVVVTPRLLCRMTYPVQKWDYSLCYRYRLHPDSFTSFLYYLDTWGSGHPCLNFCCWPRTIQVWVLHYCGLLLNRKVLVMILFWVMGQLAVDHLIYSSNDISGWLWRSPCAWVVAGLMFAVPRTCISLIITLKSRLGVFDSFLMAVVAAQSDKIKITKWGVDFCQTSKKNSDNLLLEKEIAQTNITMDELM